MSSPRKQGRERPRRPRGGRRGRGAQRRGAVLLASALSLLLAAPSQAAPSHVRREALDVTGLNHACGAATDSKGDLYLSSAGESKVNVYDPSHNLLTSIADSKVPCGLAVDSKGNLYVSERGSGEVVRFKLTSKYPFEGTTPTYGAREVIDASGKAKGIAVDPFDDRLYVAEGKRVSSYDKEGKLGIDEVQRVLAFEATGGTFKLKFEGSEETDPIEYNAPSKKVKEALEALSTIGAGNVSVEKTGGEKEFFVTFVGALAHEDVEALEGDGSGLDGGKVLVFEEAKGWSGYIGKGPLGEDLLSEASGVAPYSAEPVDGTDRYLAIADAAGLSADRVYLFGGQDIRSLSLRRELTGATTPAGSFGFGAAGAYLAADSGTVNKEKKCAEYSGGEGKEACTAGHLFLYDAAHKALDEFDGSGEYLGQATSAAFADAEPSAIAIDRSGGTGDGTIYVTAGKEAGAMALAFRPLVQPERKELEPPVSHVYGELESIVGVAAVATDSFGDVYASIDTTIHVYGPAGKEIVSFPDTGKARDLAVDSKGNVYVLDGEPASASVTYYTPNTPTPTATTVYTRGPTLVKAEDFPTGNKSLRGIAVNPGPAEGKDHLFVTATGLTREYDSAAKGSTLLNSDFGKEEDVHIGGIRESIAVNGANGNVYIGANPRRIAVLDPTGEEILARIDTTVSTSGTKNGPPRVAVDQANGHVIEFVGGLKGGAREYEALAGGFVAEFGNFTETTSIRRHRVAVDNACAVHEPPLSGKACEEFDPANGNVYIAYDDVSESHPPYDVTAFGPLKYPPVLVPPMVKRKLTIVRTGTGSGKVTTPDPRHEEQINCPPTCSAEFEEGTKVTLTEEASEGSEFVEWRGCDSIDGEGNCLVTMTKAKEVEAEFKSEKPASLEVEIEGPGSGHVISDPAGIECPTKCFADFSLNSTVSLTATPDKGSKFLEWGGACSGKGICEVTMTEAKEVNAIFGIETPPLTVVLKGKGTGTVTSEPEGIECPPTCSHEFTLNEKVELTAEEDLGSKFAGWSGCDSEPEPEPGNVQCLVTMSEPKEVKATFGALPEVIAKPAHPVLYDEATLRGEIDPVGLATEYRFEYLTEEEYEANGDSFEGAKHTAMGELAPAEGLVSVQAALLGLAEGTAYRFRLRAMNAVGPAEDEGGFATLQRRAAESCPNAQYRTGLSANLPDCRAYELATPAQTDGFIPYAAGNGDYGGFSNWLTVQRGAAAGERLSYFTDGTLPGFEGNGRFDGYRAERKPGDHPAGGWQSTLFSPDYVQAGGSKPTQNGIASDQLYSVWEIGTATTFPEPLANGVHLRTPEGFEALAKGSLGTDPKALSRYVSAGGAHAIFASREHLEETAAPTGTEAIYDRAAGQSNAAVVSVKPDGSAFGKEEDAKYIAATEDGSAVVFRVKEKTLYLRREGATTEIAEAPNTFAGVSEDGTQVFYAATAKGESSAPLYVCDAKEGPCAGPGMHPPEKIATAGIFALVSPDGSHAFFSSADAIGEETSENGEEPAAGAHNLYVWDGAQTRFIGRLASADFETFAGISGMNLAAWTRALDPKGGRALAPTRSTPGGGVFVFQSHARLSAYDNEGVAEIYRYDPTAEAGERLLCVSCDPSGAPPSADALLEDIRFGVGSPLERTTMVANLTDDGKEVFFQSFDRLVPEDVNEVEDVYEWRAKGTQGPGGDICRRPGGCLALISSGQGEAFSVLYAMSADGRDVFFATGEELVAADVAGSPSIYDAREAGGIPEAEEAAPCQGDACQGRGSQAPAIPSPATTGSGEGETPQARKPCAKGRHRVKGRCVPLKHKHRKRRRRGRARRGDSRSTRSPAAWRRASAGSSWEGTSAPTPAGSAEGSSTFPAASRGTVPSAESCEAEPRPECFGIASVKASTSTTQAGAHPDLGLDVEVKQDPSSPANASGLHDSYATTREIRFEIPPGLIGDPNAIGKTQQCSVRQLISYSQPGGGCPNASQIGLSTIVPYDIGREFQEPLYMMQPPGGEVVARVGTIAGIFPTFIDFRVRSESDYGITAAVSNATAAGKLVKLESIFWGVPAAPAHNTERCTAAEVFAKSCLVSPSRPPGGNEEPFLTNPTRCGVPLEVGVNASSWVEPELTAEKEARAPFPEITGCNHLPFGPGLEVEPTSQHTSSPTGLGMTFKLPAATGVKVLEPSQTRYMRIDLPVGFAVNTDSADGLGACSAKEVGFGENAASKCPNAAKLAATEFDIPVLERKLRGAIYLREPEPGHPYRIWILADDLGLHVKLPGELELDKASGQIHSIVVGTPETEGIPQAPLREVKLLFKSGFRAPLITPPGCGTYLTHYEFVPWSGRPPATGNAPMEITEGCEAPGFSPKLVAGSTESQGGAFSPFTVAITREDSEEDIAGLTLKLPQGLAASFAGIPHCEGIAAETGACPPESRIGKVVAALGVGPTPLWVPQAGKRPSAVYLGGPYKGAPTSVIAVVPKQAGPFDFGDEVVRSAVYVDPITAQATAQADPLPQLVEGTPLHYKTINVQLDRPGFALNPTSCRQKQTLATLTSTGGQSASPTSSYAATGCSRLGFAPHLSLRLSSGRHAAFPSLRARLTMPSGGANIASSTVIFPHSEFIENNHFSTICTKVQFASNECPAGSVYGFAKARTPLIDGTVEGPVYLRSTTEPDKYQLPDVVAALKGPPSLPVEIDLIGHVDSVQRHQHGEAVSLLRTTFSSTPDAPVSEFTLEMQGGKKGLFVNSQNLCQHRQRFSAAFTGQNGKAVTMHPLLRVPCKHRPRRR